MPTEREFDLRIILSLSEGILLTEFSIMHEAAEFLLGHPIWTHEFASKDLWKIMRASVLTQHPQLKKTDTKGINRDNYQERLAAFELTFGKTLKLTCVSHVRNESPLKSLERIATNKPIIILSILDEGKEIHEVS